MSCLIDRNKDTGKIEEVRAFPNGKARSSLFHDNLRKHLPDPLALMMWAATNTPSFKASYGNGARDSEGEPLLRFDDTLNTIFYQGERGNRILEHKSKAIKIDIYQENAVEIIKEIIDDPEMKDQPLTAAAEALFEKSIFEDGSGLEALQPIIESTKGIYDALNFNASEVKKTKLETVMVTNKKGEKVPVQRHVKNGVVLRPVSFTAPNAIGHELLSTSSKIDETVDMTTNVADNMWEGKPKEMKLELNGEWLNYDEYIKVVSNRKSKGKYKGDISHLRDELNYATNQRIAEIEAKIAESIAEGNAVLVAMGEKETLHENAYNYINQANAKKEINNRLGISEEDTVIHELSVVSELLGINARIDKLSVGVDGLVNVSDLKTSTHILDSDSYIKFFLGGDMEANELNKAKIQIMLPLFALGFMNKNIRFGTLAVQVLSNAHDLLDPSSTQYLGVEDIRSIIKIYKKHLENDTSAEGVARWNNIKNHPNFKYVLNEDNMDMYVSTPRFKISKEGKVITNFNTQDYRNDTMINMQKGIGFMRNVEDFSKLADEDKKNGYVKRLYENTLNSVEDFVKSYSDTSNDSTIWTQDISFMNMWIGGTTSNVRSPLIHVYNNYFTQQLQKVEQQISRDQDVFKSYMFPSINKFLATKGFGPEHFKKSDRLLSFFTWSKSKGADIATEYWKQFYKDIDDSGSMIKTRKTVQELKEEEKKTGVSLKEEIAFLTFLDKYYEGYLSDEKHVTRSFLYDKVNMTISEKTGKMTPIDHLDVMNGKGFRSKFARSIWTWKDSTTLSLSNGQIHQRPFSPKVPMLEYEYKNLIKQDGKYPSNWKHFFYKYFTSLFQKKINEIDVDNNSMIPIKYLGGKNDNMRSFSLDLNHQFINFATNMAQKQHLDSSLALGEAMALYLENKNQNTPDDKKVTNLIKFIRAHARAQNKQQGPKDDFVNMRKVTETLFKVPFSVYNPITGKQEDHFFSLYHFLRGLRGLTAHAVMGFGLYGAINNAFQAITTSLKLGAAYRFHERMHGGKDTMYDFKAWDFVKGLREWGAMQKDDSSIGGDPSKLEKSKLHLFVQKFRYLPTTLDFIRNQEGLLLAPKMMGLTAEKTMVFHSSVEEANASAILYAQLQQVYKVYNKKTKQYEEKTMYELYNVIESPNADNNGIVIKELVWNNDYTRGKYYEQGEMHELGGITSQEVIKMKRVYERIQGNYRLEEKSMIEMYALGALFMQFKRFLPSLIRNMAQSRRRDPSLGQWNINLEKSNNGEPSENDVYEWKERMITGKYRMFTSMFFGNILGRIPILKNNKVFSLQERTRFKDMTSDEKIQVYDAVMSMGVWTLFSVLAENKAQDDGDDDTIVKFYKRLASTSIQALDMQSVLESVASIKSMPMTTLYNITGGLLDMSHYGIKRLLFDEPEADKIPGKRKLIKNIPWAGQVERIYNLNEHLSEPWEFTR